MSSCTETEFYSPPTPVNSKSDLANGGEIGLEQFKDRLIVESGELAIDCAKDTYNGDDKEFQVGGLRHDAHQFRELINLHCDQLILQTGTIHADQDSADVLCQLKGYEKAKSFTHLGYSSPKNNQVARFIPDGGAATIVGSSGHFEIHNARSSNKFVTGITCVNSISEVCLEKKKDMKIKCKK